MYSYSDLESLEISIEKPTQFYSDIESFTYMMISFNTTVDTGRQTLFKNGVAQKFTSTREYPLLPCLSFFYSFR
jgi:hypothetical protein